MEFQFFSLTVIIITTWIASALYIGKEPVPGFLFGAIAIAFTAVLSMSIYGEHYQVAKLAVKYNAEVPEHYDSAIENIRFEHFKLRQKEW